MTSPSGLDPTQFRDLIVRPVLALLALPSPRYSEHLLMGTAAQESRFRYLKQLGSGPALGLFQMEPATFRDLWDRVVLRNAIGREVQAFLVPGVAPVQQLVWNLHFACAMCRLHYFVRPFKMPTPDLEVGARADPKVLGELWKEHYNTRMGKGTVSEFVHNYNSLVEPIYDA